jgi:hypothetical protein
MSIETSSATPPARRRRWYQFGLRTLIAITVIASVPLGLLVARLDQARRQAEAVATIRKAGGWVNYDFECRVEGDMLILEPFAKSHVAAWLLKLLGEDFFHDIVGVHAALDEGMTGAQRQDVFQSIDAIQEKKLGWFSVTE